METHADHAATPRERELELEVARLTAELELLRGEEPAHATMRLLEMASATVDAVVADARREADEIIVEISGEAEARRDEATRVAAEAEAMADRKLAEADRSQEIVDQATAEADAIRDAAEAEAAEIVSAERARIAAEAAEVDEARSSLGAERQSLAAYHQALQQRVEELAESMVTFVSADISSVPALAASAPVDLVPEAPGTDLLDVVSIDATEDTATAADPDVDSDDVSDDGDVATEAEAEHVADAELDEAVAEADLGTETDANAEIDTGVVSEPDEMVVASSMVVETVAVEMTTDDPWGDLLHAGITDDERDDGTETTEQPTDDERGADLFALFDAESDRPVEAPTGSAGGEEAMPHEEFAGVPVTEEDDAAGADEAPAPVDRFDKVTPSGSGLFARLWRGGSTTADDFGDLATAEADDDAGGDDSGLFGGFGERLLEQTPPDALADALDDAEADGAFEEFLSGDNEPDPSRDWLLRPETK